MNDAPRWLGAASYWHPEHRVESAWHQHAPFASWLVDTLRPESVVELGTHNGFSFFVFCEAGKRLGLLADFFALDTWAGDEHAGFYDEEVFESVRSIAESDYAHLAHLKRGYFSDSLDFFADGSIDLLHIDGRHGYGDAREHFETYLPKLTERGVVLFHDTTERRPGFGVWQLWAELEARYPETTFQFHHGHGMGVLGVGRKLPAAMTKFFTDTAREGDAIRESYFRLGSRISADFEAGKLAAATGELQQRLDESLRKTAALEESVRSGLISLNEVATREHELVNSTSWRVTAPLR